MTWFSVLAFAVVAIYMLFGSKVVGVMLMSGILVSALLGSAVGQVGIAPGLIMGLAFGFYISLRGDYVA